jgi:hypothetical protein
MISARSQSFEIKNQLKQINADLVIYNRNYNDLNVKTTCTLPIQCYTVSTIYLLPTKPFSGQPFCWLC